MRQEEMIDIMELVRNYKVELISGGSIVLFLCLIMMGGVMASGIMLGLISSVGFGMLFYESRESVPWLYDLMVKYPFWTDVISTILLGAMFGTSVNGLIAAAVFGIMNTVVLMVANKYDKRATNQTTSLKSHLANFLRGLRKAKKTESEFKSNDQDIIEAEFREVA